MHSGSQLWRGHECVRPPAQLVKNEQKKAKRVKGKLGKANWDDLIGEVVLRYHKAGPLPV